MHGDNKLYHFSVWHSDRMACSQAKSRIDIIWVTRLDRSRPFHREKNTEFDKIPAVPLIASHHRSTCSKVMHWNRNSRRKTNLDKIIFRAERVATNRIRIKCYIRSTKVCAAQRTACDCPESNFTLSQSQLFRHLLGFYSILMMNLSLKSAGERRMKWLKVGLQMALHFLHNGKSKIRHLKAIHCSRGIDSNESLFLCKLNHTARWYRLSYLQFEFGFLKKPTKNRFKTFLIYSNWRGVCVWAMVMGAIILSIFI